MTYAALWRRGALGGRDLGLRLVPGARATALAIPGAARVRVDQRVLVPSPAAGARHERLPGIAHHGTAAIVLAGFVACVGAPFAEEIFFRGFLYRCLRNRFAVLPACLASSALFALDHTQYPLAGKLAVLAFGVITCLLYERTGSLLPGMAFHSFVDGSGFERALTGSASVVAGVYLVLAVVLLARPPLRGLGRLLTGRPVFRYYPPPEYEPPESGQLSLLAGRPRC